MTAEAYLASKEKKRIDFMVARCALPIANAALIAAGGSNAIFRQTRVGQDGKLFEISKIKTLDEDENPRSRLMRSYRKYGLDELLQVYDVLDDRMSIVGWRALTPEDLNAQYASVGHDFEGARMVDEHKRYVLPTKPGVVSEYAVAAHQNKIEVSGSQAALCRMETELKYVRDASEALDKRLIGRLLMGIVSGKMTNSSTTIQYN